MVLLVVLAWQGTIHDLTHDGLALFDVTLQLLVKLLIVLDLLPQTLHFAFHFTEDLWSVVKVHELAHSELLWRVGAVFWA